MSCRKVFPVRFAEIRDSGKRFEPLGFGAGLPSRKTEVNTVEPGLASFRGIAKREARLIAESNGV